MVTIQMKNSFAVFPSIAEEEWAVYLGYTLMGLP